VKKMKFLKVRPDNIFTAIIVAVVLAGFITAWDWPLRASILVLVIGAMGLIVGFILLYTEMRPEASDKLVGSGMDIESDKDQMSAEANRRTIAIWAWLVGILVAAWLFGLPVALIVFAFVYAKVNGARWYIALLIGAISFSVIWALYYKFIRIIWPEPLLKQIFMG